MALHSLEHQDQTVIAERASMIMTRTVQLPDADLVIDRESDRQRLLTRADELYGLLENVLIELRAPLKYDEPGLGSNEARELLDRLDADPESHGFIGMSDPGLFYDLALYLVEGRPVHITLHNSLMRIGEMGGRIFAYNEADDPLANKTCTPAPGIEPGNYYVTWQFGGPSFLHIAKLFHALGGTARNVGVTILAQDHIIPGDQRMQELQANLLCDTLIKNGILPGRLAIRSLDQYAQRARSLFEKLCASDALSLTSEYGQDAFLLAPWLARWATLRNGRTASHVPLGPTVRRGESYVLQMLAAALDHVEGKVMQLTVGSGYGDPKSDSVSILARAIGAPYGIMHTSKAPPFPEETFGAYSIGRLLQQQIARYRNSLLTFATFEEFDAEGYLNANYREVMAQDKRIIRKVVEAEELIAQELGVVFDAPETLLQPGEAVHVCAGVNAYPMMLGSRFSIDGPGAIKAYDISAGTKCYMDRVKGGYDHVRWQQYANEMRLAAQEQGKDPSVFDDVVNTMARQMDFELQDILDLPPKSARRIDMYFGAEATVDSRIPFHRRIRAIRDALQDKRSIFVGVFTTRSGPWPDGQGKFFPAVSLTLGDIELAFLDADMEILMPLAPLDEGLPGEVRVRPDEDMVLVIARPRPPRA